MYAAPSATRSRFLRRIKRWNANAGFCRALRQPAGGRWGASSRIVATFVANLAREVKKRWPETDCDLLPYQNYTEPPEGVEFPDNVSVWHLPDERQGNMRDPAVRAIYDRWISGWRKLTARKVQLWEYQLWPETIFPFRCRIFSRILHCASRRHYRLVHQWLRQPRYATRPTMGVSASHALLLVSSAVESSLQCGCRA